MRDIKRSFSHASPSTITSPATSDCGPVHDDHPPAIDVEVLLNHSMGNVEFAMALLTELETSGLQYVEKIESSAASGDAGATGEAAHSLKGAAAIIGAESLRSLAARIEAVGESQDLAGVLPVIEELHREMARCLAQIPGMHEAGWPKGAQ